MVKEQSELLGEWLDHSPHVFFEQPGVLLPLQY